MPDNDLKRGRILGMASVENDGNSARSWGDDGRTRSDQIRLMQKDNAQVPALGDFSLVDRSAIRAAKSSSRRFAWEISGRDARPADREEDERTVGLRQSRHGSPENLPVRCFFEPGCLKQRASLF